MAKMLIEQCVERWNDERPEDFITMSEEQKKNAFREFCEWNGFDLTSIEYLFITYSDV